MATPIHRPDRTTMQGMQWNANHILDIALDPNTNGVHRALFEEAVGLVLISIVEVGFIFSGNVGTGILMKKRDDGSWSAPCAIGMTGVGWGFIAGASLKEVIVFIFDEMTLEGVAGEVGIKIGGQGELTMAHWGRSADVSLALSNKGAGGTFSVSFSKGFFGGLSVEGAIVGPRSAVNESYYNSSATPTQIIFGDAVTVPESSLMPEIYAKLTKLANGETYVSTEEEKKKVEDARKEAHEVGLVASTATDVVKIDVMEEAKKGSEDVAAK